MNKMLIWGTGKNAAEFCKNEINSTIIGFIETKRSREEFMNAPVYRIDEPWPDHDYVIVATVHSDEIYVECMSRGIHMNRFIFLYPMMRSVGETRLDILREVLKGENYVQYCVRYGLYHETFFMEDLQEYQKRNTRPGFDIGRGNLWPIIGDKYKKAGVMENYFWQDLWAARLIYRSGIRKHFDIGSRIDGFVGHLLAMEIDVSIIDIREFPTEIRNLHTIVDDATSLHQIPDESIESMSALCSLEHFGLGRYGDPIDPEACFKCFDNIQRKLAKGARLYISLPIGKERVEFNAHRVFYPSTVAECFNTLHLEEFSCTSQGKIEYNVDMHKYDDDPHNGEYRYGLFHFVKR